MAVHPDHLGPPGPVLPPKKVRAAMAVHPDHPGPPGPPGPVLPPRKFGLQWRSTRTTPDHLDRSFPRENLDCSGGPPGPPRTTWTRFPPKQIGAAMLVHPDHPGPPGPNRDLAPNRNCGRNGWFDRTIPQRKLRPQCRSTRTTPDHPDQTEAPRSYTSAIRTWWVPDP